MYTNCVLHARLVFTLPPRDSTLQYKRCVHLEINFLALHPCSPPSYKDNCCAPCQPTKIFDHIF